MRKIYSLLTIWCVLLLAPGVVEVLSSIDTRTAIPGYLAGVWIVGYLAQFGIFMWIMNLVGDQKVLWWFIASLLPWAVDWTVPVSPWFLLLGTTVVVALPLGSAVYRPSSLAPAAGHPCHRHCAWCSSRG
jgi:hypothetical protein